MPAIIPVLIEEKSKFYFYFSISLKSSMNIVGTPYKLVHLYLIMHSITFIALKFSDGKITVDPWHTAAKFPITIPKQWYKGTGRQILSTWEYLKYLPKKYPLFNILWCESVAPLGFIYYIFNIINFIDI